MTTNKPEVQRYDNMGCPEEICRVDTMHESDDGDFVLYEDYEALQAECERLKRYYKNGIECFANPCERHSGEGTPPFSEFFERYGGQCLICVVDSNKMLQANIEELRRALAESQANDRQAMAYLNEVRALVGGDDFPDMIERVAQLRKDAERDALNAENERLRCIISDLKDWDCDVRGGFLSIPVDLRRRIQNALAAYHKGGEK